VAASSASVMIVFFTVVSSQRPGDVFEAIGPGPDTRFMKPGASSRPART
jgi:hypothetical protein